MRFRLLLERAASGGWLGGGSTPENGSERWRRWGCLVAEIVKQEAVWFLGLRRW